MPTELTLLLLFAYAIAGIVAGLIGGLLGLGGGIIIVPILHYLFTLQGFPSTTIMHVAVTTSLATIIVTAMASGYSHHRKGAVLWPITYRFMPAIIIGAYCGALLADLLSSEKLRVLFGLFEIAVAIQIAFLSKPNVQATHLNTTTTIGGGLGVGLLSTLLGIGGGTLTVPLLLWCNIHLRNAIAISAACSVPIAITGTISLIIASWQHSDLPPYTIGYLYWPAALAIMTTSLLFAPLGVHLSHRLPVATLKRLFALVLLVVGVKMLW